METEPPEVALQIRPPGRLWRGSSFEPSVSTLTPGNVFEITAALELLAGAGGARYALSDREREADAVIAT